MIKTGPINIAILLKRLLYSFFFILFATAFLFSLFFVFSSYSRLVTWFYQLNACFYNATTWGSSFFTPAIKAAGNCYCIAALLISLPGAFYSWRKGRAKNMTAQPMRLHIPPSDVVAMGIIAVVLSCLWAWGNGLAAPAYDEVFSAYNAAGIHPFQCVAYYMLPNNHILFNLVNNLLFHPSVDRVVSGRVLSLLSYIAYGICCFALLKKIVHNTWLALLMALVCACSFFVWGFSFQARGYEWYLLAELGSFAGILGYCMTSRARWLCLQMIFTAAGYFIMPSMLFFHAAVVAFALAYQIIYRNWDVLFWKLQGLCITAVFLLYLPALCFSGAGAITQNTYVQPMASFKKFTDYVCFISPAYISHIFSNIHFGSIHLNFFLFLFPILLLLSGKKNKAYFLFGLFYVCLWLSFLAITSAMMRLPFERNLIGHYGFTMIAVLLALYWLIGIIPQRKAAFILKWVAYPAILLLFIIHFITTAPLLLKDTLYEYDVNEAFTYKEKELQIVPASATVASSDEEFYSLYLCGKKGCTVSKCPTGKEDYYIKYTTEPMPASLAGKYILIHSVMGCEIYHKE